MPIPTSVRVLPIVVVLVSVLTAAAAHAAGDGALAFWVAPDGDDGGAGSRARPFRTLARARDAARARDPHGWRDVVVTLRGGTHRLTEPLVLDARDSRVAGRALRFRAAPDETPIVSGAVRVEGWAVHDAALGIHRAWVGEGVASRQLWVDGQPAVRARSAAYPGGFVPTASGYMALLDPWPTWRVPRDAEAVTLAQWKMMRCPVASIDGPFVIMQQPCWKNANVFQAPPGDDALWTFRLLERFENAYELLDEPGEWYLETGTGWLYYIPLPGQDMAVADVELPVLEVLVDGQGTQARPLERVHFSGITFVHATWMGPSSDDGYAADQSGFHLTGWDHAPNVIGHARHVTRTPGNLRFVYARRIVFERNRFAQLGGVALDFDTGAQRNHVVGNVFRDVSSAAIQMGGVADRDHHPPHRADHTRDNRITNNLIERVGREYFDAAGIYVGFTTRTLIRHNDITDVPWSGIALGWGWGLFDPGSFPGLPHAYSGEWGMWETPTASRGNRVLQNRISHFLMKLWDGGAIYTQARQGRGWHDAERIAGNVASNKRPGAGGNTFYTDGGSRYVTLEENVSFDNPPGVTDFGPCDTLSALPLCWLHLPYGSDRGGCVPYGDIDYVSNYWQAPAPSFSLCTSPYPINVSESGARIIQDASQVPARILSAAGRRRRWRD